MSPQKKVQKGSKQPQSRRDGLEGGYSLRLLNYALFATSSFPFYDIAKKNVAKHVDRITVGPKTVA